MSRETLTLRFLSSLLTPGVVLLVAAWALQKDDVVRGAAAPYAAFFAFGALAAAILLSWYHDQSRLLSIALAIFLTFLALERSPGDPNIERAAIFLLPWNFMLFASLAESGVMTFAGFVRLAIIVLQAAGVASMIGANGRNVDFLLRWREQASGWSPLPLATQVSFAIAAVTLLALAFRRRVTRVEQGLLWALVAMFLGVNEMLRPQALPFYAGAAALVLVFVVLEHGYDIAYRDELTGLLGRRAFTSMMGQLGRTYAIAMCDVDHFKKFNDTYGHDAGDQVLKMVATKLSQVGGGGRVFRYGGEEFLVVFRGRSAREAAPFMEAVLKAIANAEFVLRSPDRPAKKPSQRSEAIPGGHPRTGVNISVSIGVAERSQRHSTPELVLDAADSALYRAKEAGRNCVKLDDCAQNA